MTKGEYNLNGWFIVVTMIAVLIITANWGIAAFRDSVRAAAESIIEYLDI